MGWWSKVRDETLGAAADVAVPLGAIAGYVYGGPAGAETGAALGGAIGGAIDPGDKSKGSKDSKGGDLTKQFDERTQKRLAGEAAWDDMFGSVEANMAKYYSTLSVGKIAARGNEALENMYTQASDRLSADLRARGIDTKSGVSTQLMSQQLSDLAKEKSKMYGMAEQQYRAELAQGMQLGQQVSDRVDTSLQTQAKYEGQVVSQNQMQQQIDYKYKNPYEQQQATALFDSGVDLFKKYLGGNSGNMGNLDPNNYGTRIN